MDLINAKPKSRLEIASESGLHLRVQEKNHRYFGPNSMRKWFPEEYIGEKGVLTEETATNIGYIKIVDYRRTKDSLYHNMAVIDHATAEIKASEKVFNFRTVLVANFAFLARIIFYHLIIVSLSLLPGVSVALLMLVELGYISLIANNFFKLKYLVSLHLFLGKITQSFFLLIFHTVSLIIYFKYGPKSVVQPAVIL